MSVMNVALGSRPPLSRAQRKTLAIGAGLAIAAHLAALGLVMQARGARAIWEAPPEPFVISMAPFPKPPPPPEPLQRTEHTPIKATPPDTASSVKTRHAPDTPATTASSDLGANPTGTTEPAAGTAQTGDAKVDPPQPPPAAKTDPVIRGADWARRPTSADLARFYPDRADRLGKEGQATLACVVSLEGAAENCRVESESPGGYGFGDAALRMVKSFRFRPMTVDGQAKAGGVIHIPLRWTLPT